MFETCFEGVFLSIYRLFSSVPNSIKFGDNLSRIGDYCNDWKPFRIWGLELGIGVGDWSYGRGGSTEERIRRRSVLNGSQSSNSAIAPHTASISERIITKIGLCRASRAFTSVKAVSGMWFSAPVIGESPRP